MRVKNASLSFSVLSLSAVFSLFFVAACSSRPPAVPPIVDLKGAPAAALESASTEESVTEVVNLLNSAQRSYLEEADVKPFANLLSPEVKITASRMRALGPYDSRFTKERLIHIYEWATRNEDRFSAHFVTIKAQVTGNAADVEIRLETEAKDVKSWFGQTFRLVKQDGSWQIVAFRYWPINPETQQDFTMDFFGGMDQSVEDDLRNGDFRNATYHLFVGYRFDDAAMFGRTLTDADPDDVWAWEMRAKASAMIGDKIDAEKASEMARKLKAANGP